MKKVIKQVVAIDVSQKELIVSLGRMYDDWTPQLFASNVFPNTLKGFIALVLWVKKFSEDSADLRYVLEATGVYHESLAYFLEEKGYQLTIVLPSKISNYIRTLNVKTITDRTCAEAIAMFGLEKKLESWKRPKKVFRNLRQLTRERDQIVEERTMVKNQLHAEQAEAYPNESSVQRIQKRIRFLNKQEQEIKDEIAALIKSDSELSKSVKLATSLTGVGLLTASTVLAETNGFELIRNKRQLTSYAGFDVIEKQSGTSVRGKPRISKRGNKYLRKAMHFPALTAIRHDERFKAIYARLVARHGIKMKAAVAVQRKLLEILYTVYKTETVYDKNYLLPNQVDELHEP